MTDTASTRTTGTPFSVYIWPTTLPAGEPTTSTDKDTPQTPEAKLDERLTLDAELAAEDLCGLLERMRNLGIDLHAFFGDDAEDQGFQLHWLDTAGARQTIDVASGDNRVHAFSALDEVNTHLTSAYRERDQLLSVMTALFPSVIGGCEDLEPGWKMLCVTLPTGDQAAWPIQPDNLDLFTDVSAREYVRLSVGALRDKDRHLERLIQRLRYGFPGAR